LNFGNGWEAAIRSSRLIDLSAPGGHIRRAIHASSAAALFRRLGTAIESKIANNGEVCRATVLTGEGPLAAISTGRLNAKAAQNVLAVTEVG
jgi:hypothetical protein